MTAQPGGRTEQRTRVLTLSLIALLALAGVGVVYASTRLGPVVGSDSVEHLEAARNFSQGRGLVVVRGSGRVVPLYARPPLYSLLLAGMLRAGIDPIAGIRTLNALLLGTAIAVIGLGAYAVTGSAVLGILGCLIVLVNPPAIEAFAGMMTEPVFLALAFGQLVSLYGFVTSGERRALLATVILAGLALLTRYAGLACIALAGLGVATRPGPIPTRTGRALAWMAAAAGPFALWSVLLEASGGSPGVFGLDAQNLRQTLGSARATILQAYWDWVPALTGGLDLSYRLKLAISVVGLLLIAVAVWRALRGSSYGTPGPWTGALVLGSLAGLFSLIHAAVVSLAYALVTFPRPALDARVLLPSQVFYLLALGLLGWGLARRWLGARAAAWACVLLLGPVLAGSLLPARQAVAALGRDGRGYTGLAWKDLPILAAVEHLPGSAPIVSNDIDAIMFFVSRPAYRLPDLEAPVESGDWAPFGSRRDTGAERRFADEGGYLVLFASARYRMTEVYGDRADERLESLTAGLAVVYRGPDGEIYRRAPIPDE